MSFQDVCAEQLAQLFHHYYEALDPEFERAGKPIAAAWKEVSQEERNRMVVAARLTLLELDSTSSKPEETSRYFAKAGEAEWGC